MTRLVLLIGAVVVLSSCSSSGVLPMGPDTFTIATSSELSPAYAKKAAITEASQYCQSQGKQMMPVQTSQGGHVDAFGENLATYDFVFRCLVEGDPDLDRPTLERRPDTVIEDQRR
jgi:putative hemolysin